VRAPIAIAAVCPRRFGAPSLPPRSAAAIVFEAAVGDKMLYQPIRQTKTAFFINLINY
jgi:hypothetical protein